VRHERHWSVEEANGALDWVADRLERLRAARDLLGDEEARGALKAAAPMNGGGAPGRVVSEGFLALRAALEELQAQEVVLRDLERGLVDFPSLREGEEIYLCWEQGEDAVRYWHELEAGHAGRQPL
jgi:hypothetical protein